MKQLMKIEGMSGAACANRVERVVKKLEGVDSASVNFATETLSIEYQENTKYHLTILRFSDIMCVLPTL